MRASQTCTRFLRCVVGCCKIWIRSSAYGVVQPEQIVVVGRATAGVQLGEFKVSQQAAATKLPEAGELQSSTKPTFLDGIVTV